MVDMGFPLFPLLTKKSGSYILRLATTAKALAATIDKLAADAIDGVISDDL